MDTFIEQIVVKKKDGKENAIVFAVLIGVGVLCGVAWTFLAAGLLPFAVLIFGGACYGGWWLVTAQNKEFEYCVTNGDIDIDEIIGRRKRNRLVSVAGRKIQTAGKYDEMYWKTHPVDRLVMAAPSLKEDGLYCFSYRSKKRGHTLVVFKPNDRVKEALYNGLPRLVQIEWDRAEQ